eukprot:TRINITY_DN7228_c0_g1_i1.p1 TRINITY_DN7228_c0_g1~~TRINITY_DN7228_c0_g1_i1.p1  ORF type:complete len:662 (+),score=122.37 TRINITY_DN7228_c0_g1_i1:63-1988(+)
MKTTSGSSDKNQGTGSNAIIVFVLLTLAFTVVMAIVSANRQSAFVIPGFAPKDFNIGDPVDFRVNKIVSAKTQIPYSYHHLPVCKPQKTISDAEGLGETILGDRIESSLYEVKMLVNETCKTICKPDVFKTLTKNEIHEFRRRIQEQYKVNWLLDQLPAATKNQDSLTSKDWEVGFPLGRLDKQDGRVLLYNHVDIEVSYHPEPENKYRVVLFSVTPKSHGYADVTSATYCKYSLDLDLKPDVATQNVSWTYSVTWTLDDTPWHNRWERYLKMSGDVQVHWFSILNSLMIVLFLSGMVAMILMRTLHADLRRYNSQDPEEPDETGWKLVHGDVFRPPERGMLLSVLVGSGSQVLGMSIVVMIFAVLGFLSPANRGGLMTAILVLFVWMGVFAGYFATRTYKNIGGENWRRNSLLTAIFFPGIVFATFFLESIFLWSVDSSGGVPFGTFLALIVLWFGISVPLCFFGSYFAWRKESDKQPARTNQIPRQIPAQVWYMHPLFSILMGGILPFGAVFIELFFIMSSIWLHKFYYLYGFLFIVFLILILTCAEITVVMCYFQLCSEDYNWWWRSYLTSAASAFYMFLYAIFYFATSLDISNFVSFVIYFGFSFIMCFGFFVLTGAVGFYSCYFFVRKIYGNLHVD